MSKEKLTPALMLGTAISATPCGGGGDVSSSLFPHAPSKTATPATTVFINGYLGMVSLPSSAFWGDRMAARSRHFSTLIKGYAMDRHGRAMVFPGWKV